MLIRAGSGFPANPLALAGGQLMRFPEGQGDKSHTWDFTSLASWLTCALACNEFLLSTYP